MCCTIPEVMLILCPHLTRNPILPLIGSECLIWCHWTCSQYPSGLARIHFKVNQFIIIVCVDLGGRRMIEKNMKCCIHTANECLNSHVILQCIMEYSKAPLEDSTGPLNEIEY